MRRPCLVALLFFLLIMAAVLWTAVAQAERQLYPPGSGTTGAVQVVPTRLGFVTFQLDRVEWRDPTAMISATLWRSEDATATWIFEAGFTSRGGGGLTNLTTVTVVAPVIPNGRRYWKVDYVVMQNPIRTEAIFK
jgi:hypothetical protein